MLFLAIPAILALVSLPTPSATSPGRQHHPLPHPAATANKPSALLMRCEKQQEMTLPRTFETWYATPFYQPFFVMLVKPRPILQWNHDKLLFRILLGKELQWNCCAGVLWHPEGVWLQQDHRMDTCSHFTFVKVEGILAHHSIRHSMQVTHSGMVRGVDPLPAVICACLLSWPLPGSASSWPRPQLTISKFVFVEMKVMKVLQLNLSNSTSTEVYLMNYAAVWTQTVPYFFLDWVISIQKEM